MIISRALAAVALMFALPAVAGAQVTLDLINEYPATAISGEAESRRPRGGRRGLRLTGQELAVDPRR